MAMNRKKYKQESKGITTLQRYKRFNKINLKAGDPILTTLYPRYYLQMMDNGNEKKRFMLEFDLCRQHQKKYNYGMPGGVCMQQQRL